jgi:hypothetical protein
VVPGCYSSTKAVRNGEIATPYQGNELGIIELSDEQAAALEKELAAIIDGDRYFLSPRSRMLREILHKLRPEPKREPLPSRSVMSRRVADDTADAVR